MASDWRTALSRAFIIDHSRLKFDVGISLYVHESLRFCLLLRFLLIIVVILITSYIILLNSSMDKFPWRCGRAPLCPFLGVRLPPRLPLDTETVGFWAGRRNVKKSENRSVAQHKVGCEQQPSSVFSFVPCFSWKLFQFSLFSSLRTMLSQDCLPCILEFF